MINEGDRAVWASRSMALPDNNQLICDCDCERHSSFPSGGRLLF